MRGVNDHEAPALLRFCLEHGYQLRFIEQMPLDAQHGWRRAEMVTADEIHGRARRGVRARARRHGATAARPRPSCSWSTAGPPAVGIIASVTRPFCGTCDRVRLTADGQVRNCLFAREETDLRALLRGRRRDDEIADGVAAGGGRQAARPRHRRPGFLQPDRPMSAIGG